MAWKTRPCDLGSVRYRDQASKDDLHMHQSQELEQDGSSAWSSNGVWMARVSAKLRGLSRATN